VPNTSAIRPLTRRAIPAQARSTITVEKILDAATAILFERGLQGLNTNAVATAAGINVATLYHYFPDKVAIMAELFRRDEARRVEYIRSRLDDLPHVASIDEWTTDLVHSLVELRRQRPSMVVLRQACRTVPQLLEIEEADNDILIEHGARIMRQRFRHVSPNRARNSSRVLIEVGAALIDRASLEVEVTSGIVREIIAMLVAYFDALGAAH
jgi:AcrR family transcriptional regulator